MTLSIPQIWFGLIWMAAVLAAGVEAQPSSPASRPGYVGDSSCVACHRDLSDGYQHTAHHLTSQFPSAASIHGSFKAGSNVLTIVDPANPAGEPSLQFRMDREGDKYYETAITGFSSRFQQRRESIELITGSGKRGQTFLYWQGDQLFELPVSYWTDGSQWINSPGYDNGTANFSRPVYPGCMECHSTYLAPLSADPAANRYDRASFTPGISCETCHGPGAQHVAGETGRPAHAPKLANAAILNPAEFSRDRQIDLCARCHNGIQRESLAPAFSYVPGRPLSEYFKPLKTAAVEHPDVHGNQVGLLERSRCFTSSPTMTCSTCHDTHSPERAAATYSEKCLTCHRWQSCGAAKALGEKIKTDCIDCHMPIEPTTVIVSQTADREVHATMRNHWIKIYPEAHLP